MSDYRASRIEKPEFFRIGHLMRGRGNRRPYVIGYDSEADTGIGSPMMLQFSRPEHPEGQADCLIVPETGENPALSLFLRYVARYCSRKDTEYLIYGFNLEYEFTQLFHDLDDDYKAFGDLSLEFAPFEQDGETYEFTGHLYNDKRHFLTITNVHTKRQVRLLDAMAFFKTSLDNAAKMLHLGEKYHADGVDRSSFTRADLYDPEFLRYAAQDAYITRRVGEYIVDMFETYDVTTCISAPHFASTVFRHRFLDSEIKQPDEALEQAGLWSYHGGKNGFYIPEPIILPDVYQYDITSAYPEAMRQLPNPARSDWHEIDQYVPGIHAIYHATIRYRRCQYRGFMAYDGTWPTSGIYEDVYLTGYELDAMMEREECDIIRCVGWEMVGPPGGPLVEYVDTFFAMKSGETGPKRETAKLLLNSLYGKFFQKVALGTVGWLDLDAGEWIATDPDLDYDWRAGGLYHPPIASLITGYVRAKIHRLEHKYGALMTSTDGIFGTTEPDPADIGKTLGMLTVKDGSLKIWRERLYIFRQTDVAPGSTLSEAVTAGTVKWASHGFRGPIDLLDTIPLAHGTYQYEGQQMVTLKLSTKALNGTRYTPGRFVKIPFEIRI